MLSFDIKSTILFFGLKCLLSVMIFPSVIAFVAVLDFTEFMSVTPNVYVRKLASTEWCSIRYLFVSRYLKQKKGN